MNTQTFELVGDPPYSPDLAPIDVFFLERHKYLGRQRLASAEEAFKKHVLDMSNAECKDVLTRENILKNCHTVFLLLGTKYK